jgi:hypothetical protein
MQAKLAAALLVSVALAVAGCGSSTQAEASYEVWENGCKTLQPFTAKEVRETWGSEALANGDLRGGPAAINHECEVQRRREGKTA